jgi:succinate dehydrogenase hydrophobic anchor subunit
MSAQVKARSDSDDRDGFGRYWSLQVLTPVLVLLLLFSVMLALLTWVFRQFRDHGNYRPENTLPVLLLVGVVALLSAIAITTIIFRRLGLTNWRAPLGLPEGSIRAIIALMLLVMFFISALFLYSDVGATTNRVLKGMSQKFVDAQPADSLLSVEPVDGAGGATTYNVTLVGPAKSPDAIDLAKQLVTTVSTLVVAVAAFYFGANTVQSVTAPKTGESSASESPPGIKQSRQQAGQAVVQTDSAITSGDPVETTPTVVVPTADESGPAAG